MHSMEPSSEMDILEYQNIKVSSHNTTNPDSYMLLVLQEVYFFTGMNLFASTK